MSERNGDRAKFQKNRKRKLLHRQRVQAFLKSLRSKPVLPLEPDKVAGH